MALALLEEGCIVATKGKTEAVVRLESISIDGYRSCRGTTFLPNADLSALIGINGAGKTNVLQGIRLLDQRRSRGARRVTEELSRSGSVEVTAWLRVDGAKVGLRVALSLLDSGRRSDEFVSVNELWQLEAFTGSKTWTPMPPAALLRDGSRAAESVDSQFILFESEMIRYDARHRNYDKFDASILRNKAAIDALVAVSEFRSGISYYSASQFTDPSRCPSSFEVDEEGRLNEPYLPASGSAHLRFLHDLYGLRRSNEGLYAEYCRFVSRQQLGLISRLTWKEIELSSSTAEVRSSGPVKKIKKRKTLVVPKVQIGTSHVTFNQLSEGTFKTLALAFYIITDSSKFLMIEEPEVCVHHGLLRRIVETIKAYSHRKQTIISTHSDLLVDDLEPKHVFVVEMTTSGTRVTGLDGWLDKGGREALHSYLAESGPLGEYWRSGGLT